MATLLKFLCPEPIDPLFKQNGALHGYNEDLVLTAASFLALFLVDFLFIQRFLCTKSRWFAVHAFGNAIVTAVSFNDVLRTLQDPLNAFTGSASTMVANSTVSAIHLYHCFFFKVSAADWFHHLTSLPCTLLIALPFKHYTGTMSTFGCFFLCGLPGGLNYVALVLVREGLISALQQKNFDAVINTWMRGPSMTVFAFIIWQTWLYGRFELAPLPHMNWSDLSVSLAPSAAGSAGFLIFVAALHYWNGQYYCSMAVGNYHATVAKQSSAADKKE